MTFWYFFDIEVAQKRIIWLFDVSDLLKPSDQVKIHYKNFFKE